TSPDRGCAPGKADPDLFFAPSDRAATREKARRQCRRFCPFTRDCFAWAEANGQRHGFWGGVDMGREKDRARHREMWNIPKAGDPRVERDSSQMVAQMLAGGTRKSFGALTAGEQAEVVTAYRDKGWSFA